jgi:DNA-binding MarR family transcriptional regulator
MPSEPGPIDLTDPEEQLLSSRIGQAWRELRRGAAMAKVRDRMFGSGEDALEPGQVDTLDLLAAQPAWRMSDLAEALRVDPSTATRAVQRLLRDGLAERAPSAEDGRVVMVSITAAGVARHDAVVCVRRAFFATVLAEFDRPEREQLAELLERLIGAVDHYVGNLEP